MRGVAWREAHIVDDRDPPSFGALFAEMKVYQDQIAQMRADLQETFSKSQETIAETRELMAKIDEILARR